jgi:archaeosine-15-forming tRNA-guanine transglycosylase
LQYGAYLPAIPELEFVMSRTGRVNNVLHDGVHLFSQRLTDGGLSLTIDGAKWVHERGAPDELESLSSMMPSVVVNSDAEPFVRQGRSVMHGFIVGTEGEPQTGTPCLVQNEAGELLGHGITRCDYKDMMAFRKGIAVKVKDGVGDAGD